MNKETVHNNHCHDKTLSAGVRLRKAREKLGLSQQEIAEKLCLKVFIIRDIEEDKVPSDLASTFLRGYIRSYAKLVHLPDKELLSIMENQASIITKNEVPIQSFSVEKHNKKYDRWLVIFTWLIILTIIGIIFFWWWQNHQSQQEEISSINFQSYNESNIKRNKEKVSTNINNDLSIKNQNN